MASYKHGKLDNIVESVWLRLTSRIGIWVILGVVTWAAMNIDIMKSQMAVGIEQLKQHDIRITNLENWRNRNISYVVR